ncbi:retrotransposon protein, putative, ty1-copia subclass [Tanacetum coccineum]
MKSYIDNLERLGHSMSQNLAVSLILVYLSKEYDSFVQNYNMHDMGKTVNELHAMLKLHEKTLPKKNVAPALRAIRAGKVQKKNHKTRNRNWLLGETIKGNEKVSLLMLLNPRFPLHQRREILQRTRSATNAVMQGLRGSRKLKPRALNLYVGDGHRAAVEAIGPFHLCLPSGLVLVLHNCHYAPSITRGIISVFCLYGEAKINLDSTLLWHYHLGHISKKRIEKLQHDGLLNSTNNQSFDKCVSCMSEKMERKPYSYQVERAKDLLGLIHTDEVENQLGNTIKLLRSDHGGKYMSQEFLDHLKEHGIIVTPRQRQKHGSLIEYGYLPAGAFTIGQDSSTILG